MTYLPPHFEQHDPNEIAAFLHANPLATLVVSLSGSLWPTPLPLMYRPAGSGNGTFIGHVAMINPMWEANTDQEVLAIFQGPSTYISPNWYATKQETHEVVPTWNYATVHVWGRMTVRHDDKFKRMAVGLLTQIHERSSEVPWKMGDAPQEYLAEQLNHIVGFNFEITRIKAKWKLNQNRTEADREGVIAGLETRESGNDLLIRDLMIAAKDTDAD